MTAPRPEARPRAGRYAVLLALLLFAVLAASPEILGALHLRNNSLPTTVNGVHLLPAPSAPPRVALPSVATPIDPSQPPATLPAASAARQAAAVAAEDTRIRLLVHDASSVYQPEVIAVQGSLPTLVLTAGSGAYTLSSLVQYGALVLLPHHAGLLLDNVFVSTNARLNLGGPRLRALYMDSSASGFTSIVGWGGDLYFEGTPQQPMTIMGWDRTTNSPAPDAGSGRSYIRDVGGKMVLTDVRASALGFWSGRTGGVAWTGSTSTPSTGGATGSTFTNETYGAFVTRGKNVTFDDDLFEFNELDGLHIHRNSMGTSVSGSSAVRNGGNGFLVDRATNNTVLSSDVAEHNAVDGFLIDGRPLVTGASASGGSVAADTGTYVQHSAAIDNLQSGIVLEGGSGTVLRGDEICDRLTGIAIRDGARSTVVTGNDVRCNPRAALEIGPGAPQSMISGNTLVGARVGMLIRTSGPVVTDSNRIIGATVFGITARGSSSHVSGQDNVISGTGFRAVDARADAAQPALSGTQDKGWLHQVNITVWSWLIFHPLAVLWLSILLLVILGEIWSRLRRMPPHPYPASTHWRGADSPPAATAAPAATALPAEVGERVAAPEKVTAGARDQVTFVDQPVRVAGRPPAIAREPVAMADEPPAVIGEPVPAHPPVSFVDLPVEPMAARLPGAHRSPSVSPQASERPPEKPQPSSPALPERPGSRDWFTPPADTRRSQLDQPPRLDRPLRLDLPPRHDSDADTRYWAEWPVPPPKPKPKLPPEDIGESVDTRPFPVVEGLCEPR